METRFFESPVSRSFGIHLLLLLLLFIYATQFSRPFSGSQPIEVTFVNPKEEPKVIPPNHAKDEKNKEQIVQRSKGEETDVAKKNAYLSDKTRITEDEQSAKQSGGVRIGKLSEVDQASRPHPKASHSPTRHVTLGDLGMKLAPKPEKEYNEDHHWADAQTGEAMLGGAYIQGMKEGEVSALNTKEFVFFSYFDRVRKQLEQVWPSILRENIAHVFKTGRRLASNAEYVTRTLITMNARGEIMRVQLLEESGTQDVDQAALDALNKAGPYPHPPKGLIDEQGLVQIRWDFILKT